MHILVIIIFSGGKEGEKRPTYLVDSHYSILAQVLGLTDTPTFENQ